MSKRNNPAKWYAVRKGRKPGVYTDWNECHAQVTGFKGSEFKSFVSEKDAKDYIQIGGSGGEKRKFEAVLSSSSNSVGSDERPQKVQKIAKNISLIVENDKIVLQNEHGEVHIAHDLTTVETKPHGETAGKEQAASPRKQRKPRERKSVNNNTVAVSDSTGTPTELNSDGKVDASMLQQYGTTANSSEQPVVAFIDGACTNNGTLYAKAGYGVFFGKDDARNVSKPLEGTKQTNQRAEIMAAIAALRQIEPDKRVELRTDSHYVMKAMTEWMPNWKKTNFKKQIENLDLFKTLDEVITNRPGQVNWVYVPAHTGIYGNEKADELAKKGANFARTE